MDRHDHNGKPAVPGSEPSRLPEHPGIRLRKELLVANGMSVRTAARRTRLSARTLEDVLLGNRGISGDTAFAVEPFVPTPADEWMRLQSAYDACKRRQAIPSKEAPRQPPLDEAQLILRRDCRPSRRVLPRPHDPFAGSDGHS
jgi:addiction module HigA family antidote